MPIQVPPELRNANAGWFTSCYRFLLALVAYITGGNGAAKSVFYVSSPIQVSAIPDNTLTTLNLNGPFAINGGAFNGTTSTFTAPVKGSYSFNAQVGFSGAAAVTASNPYGQVQIQRSIDGGTTWGQIGVGEQPLTPGNTTLSASITASIVFPLNPGDEVRVQVLQVSGAARPVLPTLTAFNGLLVLAS